MKKIRKIRILDLWTRLSTHSRL